MTWGTVDDADLEAIEPETSSSPLWILGIALFFCVLGFATRLFWGMGGAVAGYVLGLVAFACILVFRRRHGVLSQTTYLEPPAGLNALLIGAFSFTLLEIFFAVWPMATAVSRR